MIALPTDFLRGSYPPVLTPFTADQQIDCDAYAALVD